MNECDSHNLAKYIACWRTGLQSVQYRLHSVLLLKLEVLLPQGVDGVNHDLDQLDLGVAETVLVGDVIGVT